MSTLKVVAIAFLLIIAGCGKKQRDMASIPAGCFAMGALEKDPAAMEWEKPSRQVCLEAFSMDITEVTQAQFTEVMGSNPSHNQGCTSCPVEMVTWEEAKSFCEKMDKELPTEAQWEYAARAADTTIFAWGDEFNGDYAWYAQNADKSSQPVRTRLANRMGLYDLSGNVWEWTADPFAIPGNAPTPARVIKGGAFLSQTEVLRAAARAFQDPATRQPTTGFRCVIN